MKENACSKLAGYYRELYHVLIRQGDAFQNGDFAFGEECSEKILELKVLIETEQKNLNKGEDLLLESLIKDCIKGNEKNTIILQKKIAEVQAAVKQLAKKNKLIKSYLHPPQIAPQIIDRNS